MVVSQKSHVVHSTVSIRHYSLMVNIDLGLNMQAGE